MSLARKFAIILISSIIIITITNIIAFYGFYTSYLKIYLSEKLESRDKITIDYINEVIEKQLEDDIDNIFTDTEIEFFELLENNDWEIPLTKNKNINIVIDYLVKNWVTPKYIEEIIPSDNFWKVLQELKDKNSPEYKFINKLSTSIIITNIIAIIIIIIIIAIFTKKIILPIKEVTTQIRKLKPWKIEDEIKYYNKKDEIWLLITSINWLNKKLSLQESIRNRLLADISHELKTPITSIQCYLEGISDWVIKLNEKNLDLLTDEMKRLISLVNQIMDYEKFERKKLSLNISKENVADIIKQIVETHKKKLKENKQRIKVTWEDELILKIDTDLFKQICHNLIWNFLKYAWKKSRLTINITKNYINFSDDWEWIKSSEVQFVWEKFYQWNIEKSWDINKRWIWVWLSIIDKIIKSHGWESRIKSEKWKWFSYKILL